MVYKDSVTTICIIIIMMINNNHHNNACLLLYCFLININLMRGQRAGPAAVKILANRFSLPASSSSFFLLRRHAPGVPPGNAT